MFSPRKFNKNYLYLIILAAFFIIFVSLAKWQVKRAYEKQELATQLHARLKLPPVALTAPDKYSIEDNRFLPVLLQGQYLNEYNFLLDNQQQNKQIGYLLLTPFKLKNSELVILINRGWIPRYLRSERPKIPLALETTLTGYINNPATGILLGSNIEQDSWPIVMQTCDFNLISAKLGIKVASYVVQLKTIDYIGIGSSKHWGYAVQWMGLAITVIVYMIFMVVKWN